MTRSRKTPRSARPFFDCTTEDLVRDGMAAAEERDIETFSFALLEARQRGKALWAEAMLEEAARKAALPVLEWLQEALLCARSFAGTGAGRRRVYVVLLKADDGSYGLYVGQTGKTREARFAEHRAGYKASRHVKNGGVCLLKKLHAHLDSLTVEEANDIEARLADAFGSLGVWTEGGH